MQASHLVARHPVLSTAISSRRLVHPPDELERKVLKQRARNVTEILMQKSAARLKGSGEKGKQISHRVGTFLFLFVPFDNHSALIHKFNKFSSFQRGERRALFASDKESSGSICLKDLPFPTAATAAQNELM